MWAIEWGFATRVASRGIESACKVDHVSHIRNMVCTHYTRNAPKGIHILVGTESLVFRLAEHDKYDRYLLMRQSKSTLSNIGKLAECISFYLKFRLSLINVPIQLPRRTNNIKDCIISELYKINDLSYNDCIIELYI